jgi:signal transduction histidine kinase/CheY-like chemotaxis protein
VSDQPAAEEVLIVAGEADGWLTVEFLASSGIAATTPSSLDDAFARIRRGELGAVVMTEEAVASRWGDLLAALQEQPAWSDVPLVLFLRPRTVGAPIETLSLTSSVTLLERPVRRSTLVSTVRAALRARARQVQLRDSLQRMEEANRRLAQADRRKDEFLAMLGHELRNPLNAIYAALQILDVSPPVPGRDRALEIVGRQVRHLKHLVDDVLDVSRVTMGKIKLAPVPTDLRELARRCAQALEFEARQQGLTLAVRAPDEPLMVSADPVRFEQILSNLVTNAIKYSRRGGRVELVVAREGDQAVLRVRDDGIGIPADLLPSVFELFTQDHGSLDRARGGLGLGLPVVKQLVDMHGGQVEALSDGPDRGTEVVVRLAALEPADVPPRSVRQARAPSSPARLDVVVVEDVADTRELVRALLELMGHDVQEAEDGVEGLDLILRARPDVALVDIGLPRLDGYAVAREVRARAPSQVLVALTGYGQPEDRARALEAGFDAHVVKPIELDQLEKLLVDVRAAASTRVRPGQPSG